MIEAIRYILISIIISVAFHIGFSILLGFFAPNIVWTGTFFAELANFFRYLPEVYPASMVFFLLSLAYFFRKLKYLFVIMIIALVIIMNRKGQNYYKRDSGALNYKCWQRKRLLVRDYFKFLGPQAHYNYKKRCNGYNR